jgi:hypothetical protein
MTQQTRNERLDELVRKAIDLLEKELDVDRENLATLKAILATQDEEQKEELRKKIKPVSMDIMLMRPFQFAQHNPTHMLGTGTTFTPNSQLFEKNKKT